MLQELFTTVLTRSFIIRETVNLKCTRTLFLAVESACHPPLIISSATRALLTHRVILPLWSLFLKYSKFITHDTYKVQSSKISCLP